MPDIVVRRLEPADIPTCERILRGLPDWFGFEDVNRRYIGDLSVLPALVACVGMTCSASSPSVITTRTRARSKSWLWIARRTGEASGGHSLMQRRATSARGDHGSWR